MARAPDSQRRTILFSGHNFGFLRPFISYCESSANYKVVIEEHASHEIVDEEGCARLLAKADIVFCEWCLGNAVWYSHRKEPFQKLIVRLHSQELRLPFLDKVAWDKVDALVAICPLHLNLVLKRYPFLSNKSILIYNPIDCDALDKPKLFGAEFNLGLLGMCPRLKAPHIALEIFQGLRNADRRYTLYIKGKRPSDYKWLWERAEERQYYDRFYETVNASDYGNSVVFDEYDSNVSEWFSKIGFILSTSEREGSHQSVAEGMASGSLPIIRNWPGAELLYPERFIFKTVPAAVDLIRNLKTAQNYRPEFQLAKDYAKSHFDHKLIAEQYEKLFSRLYQPTIELAERSREQGGLTDRSSRATADTTRDKVVAMHVCFLTPGKQNGYAIRVIEETRARTQQGIEVVIACFLPEDQGRSAERKEFQHQIEERTGSKCYLLPTKDFFNTALALTQEDALSNSLCALAQAHQVDVLHGQALYSTMHALRARRRFQAKVVFDVHGISPEELELGGASAVRTKTMAEMERHALEQADLRVFVSGGMREHFQKKYGLGTTRLDCVVPCCVHGERFAMAEEERVRKRRQTGFEGKFVFLYLGTLSVWQWPEALFSVFAQFHQRRPESLFYLLLPVSDHKLALSFCQARGLQPDSYLLNEVPHQEVGSVVGVADAGLLLRRAHPVNAVASPTKFGEYLAAGVPVVATENIGDTSELVREEHLGVVVSPTDDGLTASDLEKLLTFADNVKEHRSDWSTRAAFAANHHLGWTARVQALVDKYHELSVAPVIH